MNDANSTFLMVTLIAVQKSILGFLINFEIYYTFNLDKGPSINDVSNREGGAEGSKLVKIADG